MATTEEIVAKYRLDLDDLKKQVSDLQGEFKKVDDTGKKSAENVDKSFGKLSDKLKDLGKVVVAAFAVDRIIAFGKQSVEAFAAAEQGALKLRSAVTAAGGLQGDFEKLTNQAEELAAITIFDDDAIKAAQTLALQFGLNSSAVEKLIPKVADFAAATGQDLNQALQATLGGINGQVDGLKRFGIELDTSATKNERFAAVVEQLNGKFEGQAQILTQTLSGSIGQAEKAFGELQESIGGALAPAVTVAAKALTGLFTTLQNAPTDPLVGEITGIEEFRVKLNDVNTTQEERKLIIDDLQKRYPPYLANINAEKVSNEELNEALAKVTSELVDQLVIKQQTSKVDEKQAALNEKRATVAENEGKAAELLAQARARGIVVEEKFTTIAERSTRAVELLRAASIRAGESILDAPLRDLAAGLNQTNKDLKKSYTEAAQAEQDLTQQQKTRATVLKELGLETKQVSNEVTNTTITGLEKQTAAEKKAAQEKAAAAAKAAAEIQAKVKEANEKQAAEELKQREELSKAELAQDLQNLSVYDSERRRAINARYDAEEQAAVEAAQQQQQINLQQLQAGLITVEQYEKKKQEIAAKVTSRDPQRTRALLEQDINTLQLQIQNRRDYGQDVTELEQQLADKTQALQQNLTADQLAQSQQRILTAEEEAKRKAEILAAEAEQQKQINAQIVQQAVELADQLFALANVRFENQLQNAEESAQAEQDRIDAAQTQLDTDLENRLISQQEYERQRALLDADRAASEKKLDEETKKIKRKQDATAKAQSIFKLGLDTANAIVAQLAATPLPAGAPLVALIGTIAAAQLAAILAAKPPQYAEGIDWVPLNGNRRGRDTIPAMLDEGERVISRRKNERHWDLYQAIDEDRLPQYIFQKYTQPALEKERATGGALARALSQTLAVQQGLGNNTPDSTELRRLWRRGLAINNLDELADLLDSRNPSPYRS